MRDIYFPHITAGLAWIVVLFMAIDALPGVATQPEMVCGNPIYQRDADMNIHTLFDQAAGWGVRPMNNLYGSVPLRLVKGRRAALVFSGKESMHTMNNPPAPSDEISEVICVGRGYDRWQRH